MFNYRTLSGWLVNDRRRREVCIKPYVSEFCKATCLYIHKLVWDHSIELVLLQPMKRLEAKLCIWENSLCVASHFPGLTRVPSVPKGSTFSAYLAIAPYCSLNAPPSPALCMGIINSKWRSDGAGQIWMRSSALLLLKTVFSKNFSTASEKIKAQRLSPGVAVRIKQAYA